MSWTSYSGRKPGRQIWSVAQESWEFRNKQVRLQVCVIFLTSHNLGPARQYSDNLCFTQSCSFRISWLWSLQNISSCAIFPRSNPAGCLHVSFSFLGLVLKCFYYKYLRTWSSLNGTNEDQGVRYQFCCKEGFVKLPCVWTSCFLYVLYAVKIN